MPDADVDSMNIAEVFNEILKYYSDDEDEINIEEKNRIYNLMRYGIEMHFDIYDYLHQIMKVKEKQGIILGRNTKTYEMGKFWTEIEKRTIEGRKWIKKNGKTGIQVSAYD